MTSRIASSSTNLSARPHPDSPHTLGRSNLRQRRITDFPSPAPVRGQDGSPKRPEDLFAFIKSSAKALGFATMQHLMQEVYDEANREAAKKTRKTVITIIVSARHAAAMGEEGFLNRFREAGEPLSLVKAVQFPTLNTKKVLLILDSESDARKVRECEGKLKKVLQAPEARFQPERFCISPTAITKSSLQRMTKDPAATKDYDRMFNHPVDSLPHWKRETGLDIKKAYWKYGRLWMVLWNLEEARRAVHSEVPSSLSGIQTYLTSLNPQYVPKQCFKCHELNHMLSECPSPKPRCGYCLLEHWTKDCEKQDPPKCLFCKIPHPSYLLSVCNHPRVQKHLKDCKSWRGPAEWATDMVDSDPAPSADMSAVHSHSGSRGVDGDLEAFYGLSDVDYDHEHMDSTQGMGSGSLHQDDLSEAQIDDDAESALDFDFAAASDSRSIMSEEIDNLTEYFSIYDFNNSNDPSALPQGEPMSRNISPSPSSFSSVSRLAEVVGTSPKPLNKRTSGEALMAVVGQISRGSVDMVPLSSVQPFTSAGLNSPSDVVPETPVEANVASTPGPNSESCSDIGFTPTSCLESGSELSGRFTFRQVELNHPSLVPLKRSAANLDLSPIGAEAKRLQLATTDSQSWPAVKAKFDEWKRHFLSMNNERPSSFPENRRQEESSSAPVPISDSPRSMASRRPSEAATSSPNSMHPQATPAAPLHSSTSSLMEENGYADTGNSSQASRAASPSLQLTKYHVLRLDSNRAEEDLTQHQGQNASHPEGPQHDGYGGHLDAFDESDSDDEIQDCITCLPIPDRTSRRQLRQTSMESYVARV
ncbi:hypothetical protein NW762_010749 [Fusarium torreyae]|uniref:CCHC-type domain-containing protein n=1 Tax=Fusarium torreyae TaxID=1237075 RepID=A0A9W8VD61_9HYPO|nr:hypothetical protein NW762_010749 [Fusarium torreyae]